MIRAICDLVDINIHAPVVRPIVRSIGEDREQMEYSLIQHVLTVPQ